MMIYRSIPAAWLHVSGEDTFSFLQGQFSNDLRPLQTGQESAYGLWLNHKGRVLADSVVVAGRVADFWIASFESPASAVRERLEAYIIADDVVLADETAAWGAATVIGAGEEREAREAKLRAAGGFAFPARRGIEGAREWIFPAAREAEVAPLWAGGRELDRAEMEWRRIEAGVPAVPRDLGPGDLPQEGGLERDAVAFTKGCYLGQEVMARLHAMGQVRRRLIRVRGVGSPPPVPVPLFQAGRPVGELRSVAGREGRFVGLALLTLLNLDRAAGLALAAEGPAELTLGDSS